MVVIRMKISKFAEVNNVSVDTIRHYMDLGLVIPEKKGSHYFFDEYCQKGYRTYIRVQMDRV